MVRMITIAALLICFALPTLADEGRVYVGNCSSSEVLAFTPDGELLFSFGHADLLGPRSMAFSPAGELHVASIRSGEVFVFDQEGAFLRRVAVDGVSSASAIAFGPDGLAYLASYDSGEVVVLSGETEVRRLSSYSLTTPNGLAFNENGDLYVTNESPPLVARFDSSGNSAGDFTCMAMVSPASMVTSNDRLYVASGSGSVVVFDLFGEMETLLHMESMGTIDAVALGADGHLTVSSGTTGYVARMSSEDGTYLGHFESTDMFSARSIAYAPIAEVTSRLFVRGDSNGDESVDLSDALATLGYLYLGRALQSCPGAADANDNARIEMSDAVYLLSFLFTGGAAPAAPFPVAGEDPTADSLFCAVSTSS